MIGLTVPRWVAVLFIANVGLWAVEWGLGFRVADDPMFAEPSTAHKTSGQGSVGMSFDLHSCADCPLFVLLGRAVGSPGLTPYGILGLVNAPAIALATGTKLGYGVHELWPGRLVAGLATEWLLVGAVWHAWRRSRSNGGALPAGTEPAG